MKMCKRLMGSIDLFKQVRNEYTSKKASDVHTTSAHAVADPLLDQLKGAWFCLKMDMLNPHKSPEALPKSYPLDGQGCEGAPVSKCYLDVEEKGSQKLQDNFTAKLYECFPDLRYQLLLDV